MTFSELVQNSKNNKISIFDFFKKNRLLIIALLFVLIILIVLYGIISVPKNNNVNLTARASEEQKEAVIELEKIKDYSEALNNYSLLVKDYPGDIFGYSGMLRILIFKNNDQFFDEILEKSSIYLKGDENALLNLTVGIYYFNLSDFDKSETYISKSYELDKTNPETSLYYAKLLVKKSEFEKARKVLDVNDDGSDNYIEGQILKAYLWGINFQNVEGQLSSLDTKIIENADLKAQYTSLKSAVLLVEERNAENIESAVILSKEYCQFGYGEIAIFVLEEFTEDLKIYEDGLYYLILSNYLSGEYSEVVTLSYIYNDNFGNNDSINLILARIYTVQNDIPNLEMYYEKILNSSDNNLVNLVTIEYTEVLEKNEQYSKAIMILNNLDETGPDSIKIRKLYIEAYLGMENWEKAQFHITRALESTDLDVTDQVYFLSKDVLVSIKEESWDSAQNKLILLGDIDQTSKEYNYYKGVVLFSNSKFSESAEYFEKAIEYDNDGVITEKSKYYLNKL